MDKIRIGVSSCLLGHAVRFDGQHKRDRFITDVLGEYCTFVPVCPEVECGLPIPRESMRLVGDPKDPRLMTGKTKRDHSPRMKRWIERRLHELEAEDLVGFIFKTKSPSSGLRNVKVYNDGGQRISSAGQGLFAKAFTQRFPEIAVEDEGRLHDPVLRENFIETLFVLQRWREKVRNGRPADLVAFHSRHKYVLMAHSPEKLRNLGRLTAQVGSAEQDDIIAEYRRVLFDALHLKKTPRKNYNVLLHMVGYFKKLLSADEKAELLEAANQYYRGLTPLIAPLTLIKHYTRKYRESYLEEQWFLDPLPAELRL